MPQTQLVCQTYHFSTRVCTYLLGKYGSWPVACWPLGSRGKNSLNYITLDVTFDGRRQALPAIAVGHIIIAVVMVLNGTHFSVINKFYEVNAISYLCRHNWCSPTCSIPSVKQIILWILV